MRWSLTTKLLSCAFICFVSAQAQEVSVDEDAPALKQKAEEWIEKYTDDSIGGSVGGVNVSVERHVYLDDVTFDSSSLEMRIKARIEYKTSNAVIPAKIPPGGPARIDITYNVRTGDLQNAKIELFGDVVPGGIKLDLTPIKKAIEGDIGALLELIPNGGVVERKIESEYDDRKKQFQDEYGKENIYFASSDFVRWAGPETAGKWIVALVGSGGTGSAAIAAEAKAQVRKEFRHILVWMETKAGGAAQGAVNDLVEGKPITLPALKLVWQRVMYRSTVKIAGNPMPQTPALPHAAFVLVWETPGKPSAAPLASAGTMTDDSAVRSKWSLGARCAIGPTGCRITYLKPGGAAEKAGLKVDDVITKVGTKHVGDVDLVTDHVNPILKKAPNGEVDLEYVRGTATQTLHVVLDPVL